MRRSRTWAARTEPSSASGGSRREPGYRMAIAFAWAVSSWSSAAPAPPPAPGRRRDVHLRPRGVRRSAALGLDGVAESNRRDERAPLPPPPPRLRLPPLGPRRELVTEQPSADPDRRPLWEWIVAKQSQ